MSITIIDGGPAFPCPPHIRQNNTTGEVVNYLYLSAGISVRDYFAAKAMQGYLASFSPNAEPAEFAGTIAKDAYIIANAMLAARGAA
jgi:hypothetical protein